MTVTNKKAHPVLTSLQTLLQPDTDPSSGESGDPKQTAAILANKVTTSLKILATAPSLHSLALEVIANALVFQYSHYEQLAYNKKDESLSGNLDLVWRFLDVSLNHCPKGWAGVLFKWCVSVLGRLCKVQSSPARVEEAMQKWLGLSMLSPIHSFLNRCSKLLVASGNTAYCMEVLLPLCTSHAPNLNWLLAHTVSQYPSQMIPVLLEHTLSYPYPHTITPSQPAPHSFTTFTQALEYLSRTHRDILKGAVVSAFEDIFDRGKEKTTAASFNTIRMLLMVATHCRPMTQFVAMDCLDLVTSSKVRRLITNDGVTTPTKGAHDSHVIVGNEPEEEEDEGEILSDEEDMEQDKGNKNEEPMEIKMEEVVKLVSELLGQLRGREASKALSCVMDIYLKTKVFLKTQEETVEEGEIVRESPLEFVVEGCSRIMSSFLSQLHSSTCHTHLTPKGQSSGASGAVGSELDMVVSLQSGVLEWAGIFLDLFEQDSDNHICISWLQELITCVCICSSELVAGRVMAHLLLHCSCHSQLLHVLEIYWEVHTRHPYLANTAIKTAISVLQHQTSPSHFSTTSSTPISKLITVNGSDDIEPEVMVGFVRSMLTILEHIDNGTIQNTAIRCAFLSALSDQVLSFSRLLVIFLSNNAHHQFILTLDLLSSILTGRCKTSPSKSSLVQSSHVMDLWPQSRCKLIQDLLSSFFSLLKTRTRDTLESGQSDLSVELSLGKCRYLIGWCTSTSMESNSSPSSIQSARILAYSTILETVLSEEMNCYFSDQKLSQARIAGPSPSSNSHSLLLTSGRNLSLSHLYHPKFNSREVRHSGTLNSRQSGYGHRHHKDHVEIAVIGNSSHLLQLLLAIGVPDPHKAPQGLGTSTPTLPESTRPLYPVMEGLATIVMDLVAPQCSVDLQTWPEEDSLKYTLESDLSIKRKFDENPILWHLLLLLSGQDVQPRPLMECACIVHSLLTVLTQHWLRCRSDKVSMFPRELESSVLLMECLAQASWLPAPLSSVGELFPCVSTQELHLLLTAVSTFIKENFTLIQSKDDNNYKDTGYRQLVKSSLLNNIEKLGALYPRFMKHL